MLKFMTGSVRLVLGFAMLAVSGLATSQTVSVSNSVLFFGNVPYGLTEHRPFTIFNVGSAPLQFSASLTSPSHRFTSCDMSVPIPPGGSCHLDVMFSATNFGLGSPSATLGASTGALLIVSNDPNNPAIVVELLATSTATVAWTVSGPGSVSVTPVPISQSCAASTCTGVFRDATVVLAATSSSSAHFDSWGGDCSGTGVCIVSIPPGRAVLATFDTLPRMETSATSLRFGEESVGEMGTPALITVSNSGFSALNIADVQAAGAHDTDFEVLGNCRGSSIPQGQSCDAVVVFVPSALGMRTGSLQLTSNDPTSPIRSISLSGTGAANVPGMPPDVAAAGGNKSASLSFGPATDGGSPVLSYVARCLPGEITATGAGSPIVITGLSNGSTYFCAVKAANAVGEGAFSDYVFVKPPH